MRRTATFGARSPALCAAHPRGVPAPTGRGCRTRAPTPHLSIGAASSSCRAGRPRTLAFVRRSAGRALPRAPSTQAGIDRKSVVEGKSVSVRVVLGGRLIIKDKKTCIIIEYHYAEQTFD